MREAGASVLVVGGGLAGMAAAVALAPRGFRVTLLEARPRLGGRAGSFTDATTGQLIDACQHVSMGCCTNLSHFFRTVGVSHFLEPQRSLHFMTPDRRMSRFSARPWPAPFHLAPSFLALHFLSATEKMRIAWGLQRLKLASPDEDIPFATWLENHGQTRRTVERFWGLVLTSALNESPERIGLRYARKVFVDGFLSHPLGFQVEIPTVPLGRFYGAELQHWLDRHGVQVRLGSAARRIVCDAGRVHGIELRSSEILGADHYIAAVPFDRLLDLLSADEIERHAFLTNLRRLESSPITSVHLWLDRPVLDLPHIVLVDCTSQWVFNRGDVGGNEYYLQVVVSASRQFRQLGHEEVERLVIDELGRLFPAMRKAVLRRARVVTEHAATFSATPGVDQWRPRQQSPWANLAVAGDWTATGWPATMEGAVRSGYLAAEAVLARMGIQVSLVQPDLR